MRSPVNRPPDAALARLTRLHPKIIDLSLGRIERLLDRLGNPERRLPPVVHIAGTNGKGSVIAYLRAIMEATGRRAHVYTSPHLVRFNERIVVAGSTIDDGTLSAVIDACEAANGDAPITFFEITTAAAMLAFADTPADILLLETGLGGRLDATNVIARPRLTAITPISLDHQSFLGDTLSEIAAEKAAILKSGVTAVIAAQPREAMVCIERNATVVKAPLLAQGNNWHVTVDAERMIVETGSWRIALPLPGLAGAHQVENAAQAVVCATQLAEFDISEQAIADGIATARWPGRLQRLDAARLSGDIPPHSEVWIDGGHNPAAASALSATLESWDDRPLHLVVGMLNSKDAAGFLAPLVALATTVSGLAIPGETNSHDAGDIAAAARACGAREAESYASLHEALQGIASRGERAPRILVCGSLHLAGHLLARYEAAAIAMEKRKTG